MGVMIELPEDLYEQSMQRARERGIDLDQLLREIAQEKAASSLQAALQQMRAEGGLRSPIQPAPLRPDFQPIHVKDEPLSDTILKERR